MTFATEFTTTPVTVCRFEGRLANERMAAALKAKGYPYRYVSAEAAGHADGRVTQQTLPGALERLWQGYSPTPHANP